MQIICGITIPEKEKKKEKKEANILWYQGKEKAFSDHQNVQNAQNESLLSIYCDLSRHTMLELKWMEFK